MELIKWYNPQEEDLPDGFYLMCRTDDDLNDGQLYPIIFVYSQYYSMDSDGVYDTSVSSLDEEVRLFGPIPKLEQ